MRRTRLVFISRDLPMHPLRQRLEACCALGEYNWCDLGFAPKSELGRIRLIREARARYVSIFPPIDVIGERPDDGAGDVRRLIR